MIGIILATKREAKPVVEALSAVEVPGGSFAMYRFAPVAGRSGGVIVISGMGRVAAARGTEHLITDCGASSVINVGICGALSDAVSPSEIYRIDSVVDGDAILADEPVEEALLCSDSACDGWESCRLASVAVPVFEEDRRRKLGECSLDSHPPSLVDMEGYSVAGVCRRHGVAVIMLKGVTDLANHTGKQDIVGNIDRVSNALADAVVACLSSIAPAGGGRTAFGKLMNFAKIEHSLFSLPLLLAGAKLGAETRQGSPEAWPSLGVLGLIALAGIGARSMGMAMNRVFDRKLDALNPRTAGRELPSGQMPLAAGLGVAAGGLGLYLLACWLLGPLCLALSFVPAVPLITYSLLKRFTNLCHFGIGLCMALAPLGGYVAASGTASPSESVLSLALFTFCWMSGFDIIYALQDIASDRQTGVRSLPASLGFAGASAVAAGVHVVALAGLAWLWLSTGGGWFGGAAFAIAAGALVLGNLPSIPAAQRFFPISAIASFAGAVVPLIGWMG